MERLLAVMLMMSLMTVSCNKSGDGSSGESSTTTSTEIEGSEDTDTVVETDPATDTGADTDTKPDDTSTDTGTYVPKPVPAPAPAPKPTPAPAPTPNVPSLALSFKTNVEYLDGFSTSDEEKYNKAVALVKKVVATEAFRTKVLNHTYGGEKTFVQNNGLTNEQIYQSILDAAEKLKPTKNNTLDVGVKLYYENNNVVGYTSTGITYINVNTKFFDSYAINSVASNLFHEWLHKLGYGHDSAATARRPYSVPYAVGYMVRDIGKNFL